MNLKIPRGWFDVVENLSFPSVDLSVFKAIIRINSNKDAS